MLYFGQQVPHFTLLYFNSQLGPEKTQHWILFFHTSTFFLTHSFPLSIRDLQEHQDFQEHLDSQWDI